jgi:hypothetical protein
MKQTRVRLGLGRNAVNRSSLRRTAIVIAVLVVLGSLAVGAGPASAKTARAKTSNDATTTQVRIKDPFTADGHLRRGLTLGSVLLGHCWEGSIASQQRNAWRCFSGNDIYDPCFKHAGVRDLICMKAPWSKRVDRLRLTRHLPSDGNSGITRKNQPWGFKLLNGTRCILGTGTAAWVGPVALPYYCPGHGYATLPKTRFSLWRVRHAPNTLDRLNVRRVSKAWF